MRTKPIGFGMVGVSRPSDPWMHILWLLHGFFHGSNMNNAHGIAMALSWDCVEVCSVMAVDCYGTATAILTFMV